MKLRVTRKEIEAETATIARKSGQPLKVRWEKDGRGGVWLEDFGKWSRISPNLSRRRLWTWLGDWEADPAGAARRTEFVDCNREALYVLGVVLVLLAVGAWLVTSLWGG